MLKPLNKVTKKQTRALLAHLKDYFANEPIVASCQGEVSEKFPRRWVAERRMASVYVIVDGGERYTIELPA